MKTIFISGANRGLGLSLAKLYLEAGNRVFAGTRSASAPLTALESQYPGAMHLVVIDVSSEESVRAAGEAVGRMAGRLDLIINNAALLYRETAANPIERIDLDAAAETLDVNAMGPLRVLKYFLPLLDTGPREMVVNISSEAGSIADCQRDAWYAYCMSKAALNMASMILQNYLRGKGIKVLAVHPGWMRTRMGGEDAKRHAGVRARHTSFLASGAWTDRCSLITPGAHAVVGEERNGTNRHRHHRLRQHQRHLSHQPDETVRHTGSWRAPIIWERTQAATANSACRGPVRSRSCFATPSRDRAEPDHSPGAWASPALPWTRGSTSTARNPSP